MPQTLALIHTSAVFISVESMIKQLLTEILPEVRLINILDDCLLSDLMGANCVTHKVIARFGFYVMAAENAGANAVLSLCSSMGRPLT